MSSQVLRVSKVFQIQTIFTNFFCGSLGIDLSQATMLAKISPSTSRSPTSRRSGTYIGSPLLYTVGN